MIVVYIYMLYMYKQMNALDFRTRALSTIFTKYKTTDLSLR